MVFRDLSWRSKIGRSVSVASFALLTLSMCQAADEGLTVSASCTDGAVLSKSDDGQAEGCLRTRYSKSNAAHSFRVGAWLWRDARGQIVYRANYNDAGQLDGAAEAFSADGQLIRRSTYANNVLNGAETTYWPGGHIREAQSYKAGKLNGVRKRWTYSPPPEIASRCDESNEDCWEGSQECWLDGERKSHGECARAYADVEKGRRIASISER